MRSPKITIGDRCISKQDPVFIIAEAGVNHNGDLALAKQLVDAAVSAGADCVKFQTFKAEDVISEHAPKAAYQLRTTSRTESQLDMAKKLELPFAAFRELNDYCRAQNIMFLSSPFDLASVDFLTTLDVPAFKIPSGEITNFPLLECVARKRKPIIMSTGMSSLLDVQEAVGVLKRAGNSNIVLLHCVSAYPADPRDANLRAIHTMETALELPVGFSDHTPGIEIALAAVALGACVIEKHFTLSQDLPGPDHKASLEPEDLSALVHGIRKVEAALGHGRKEPLPCERNVAAVARKSLVAALYIPLGSVLTEELVAIKRPGTGLPPSMLAQILGHKAKRDIPAGTLLSWEMLV